MQTHEITGYDDTWEYATTTVTGGNPPRIIQHPPGEGWVIDDAPQNQRDRYRWKRPIAYAAMNAAAPLSDPTTEQMAARNRELEDLRRGCNIAYEKLQSMRRQRDEALAKVGALTRQIIAADRFRADKLRDQREVVTSKDLADQYRAENAEVAFMAAEITRLTGVIRKLEDAATTPAPTPMFLTCPMCSARHIDEGEFATKVHHTHSCQNCGLTWRPAVGPTVGVQYLPGFKSADATPTPTHMFRWIGDAPFSTFSCSCGVVFSSNNPDDEYTEHVVRAKGGK